jgi:hypothetical protein
LQKEINVLTMPQNVHEERHTLLLAYSPQMQYNHGLRNIAFIETYCGSSI